VDRVTPVIDRGQAWLTDAELALAAAAAAELQAKALAAGDTGCADIFSEMAVRVAGELAGRAVLARAVDDALDEED
jgi:hypothetical protein